MAQVTRPGARTCRAAIGLALVLTTTGAAADEPLPAIPDLGPARSLRERLEDRITLLGDVIDEHLGNLTLDAVAIRFDGRARRATVRLRGETRYLSLHVDGDVHFVAGVARVATRIDLAVGDRHLHVELPDIEVVPRSYLGERYVEVRLPLLEARF